MVEIAPKRLCIVPARGGSKRLPNKNQMELDGKPLIYHTLETVVPLFDKTIFTSDSFELLKLVEKLVKEKRHDADWNNKVVVGPRPKQLATDTSKVIDTVEHYFKQHRRHFDQIWLALPTCPLRLPDDISAAQKLLTEEYDGVISVTEYGFPPQLGLTRREDGTIFDWHTSEPWQNNDSRSQDHAKIFRPNGAIYGMWMKTFERKRNFYLGKITSHFMPRERSVDIDTKLDFKVAELLLEERKNVRSETDS